MMLISDWVRPNGSVSQSLDLNSIVDMYTKRAGT